MHPTFQPQYVPEEIKMRSLIFGALLLAAGSLLFHGLISASLAAAREGKPATFAERFAPVLKPTQN